MIRHFVSYQAAINALLREGFWGSSPSVFLNGAMYATIHEVTGTSYVMVAVSRME